MEEFSTRQNKISRLIQKELADYFQKESRNYFRGKIISVTIVRVTRDLGIARIYLSIFPNDGSGEILDQIVLMSRQIRGTLGKRVGKQLRIIPELEFYIDDSLDYIKNINNLLNK
ncbi:MAG: 30S ribosome-binding factor RbfA [Prolixibacteraceae bacterium]|nr:30S ribosome-binding factor RbfA [Prolixibacteraceae bacterium]MBN2775408.1 30S ribosome-binding factor RbfA [Prolixibacteraceae bacterium]